MNSKTSRPATVGILNFRDLQNAAEDFRYLLNHGYPRKATLELVGNRYGLTFDERHLLHRGVFSDTDSDSRRKKKIPIVEIRNKDLAIDGHNVLITIEAGLSGRPLILADDGFIRDISGLSGSFRRTETTEEAVQLIIRFLQKWAPRKTLFLFDAPISNSGKLAQEVRSKLEEKGLPGDAMAVRVPEKILIGFPGLIATSDTAIIDQSKRVVDLAGDILRNSQFRRLRPSPTLSFIQWRRKRGPIGKR
jgi:hypothetical protein